MSRVGTSSGLCQSSSPHSESLEACLDPDGCSEMNDPAHLGPLDLSPAGKEMAASFQGSALALGSWEELPLVPPCGLGNPSEWAGLQTGSCGRKETA